MNTQAIVMMIVSMVLVWGGLAYWIWNLRFKPTPELPEEVESFISAIEAEGEDAARAASQRVGLYKRNKELG
ncbi:methionine/alanine import family NSS transporter small subunit [Boudabousia marimammalium]|uniref:Methionine/alanine importer small subunit n=1 Tax=Boudabousia marimammalium TaxID=156892 RepID=A0A1Q5PSG0_9ACTO|nr:methionine/alanine import family NSS transporter small subunit [Boudabousia marimammalium]OKL50518.1 hypothetical protein BM477_00665 [Boudabousia marimammalium]